MFIHDIIKIKYVDEGYLPNYPYHLISDDEMVDAFIHNDINYFGNTYQIKNEHLKQSYSVLIDALKYHVDKFKEDKTYEIPNWVYSYMLGEVVCDSSSISDRHDLLVLLGLDNIDDQFTEKIESACLDISSRWISKLPSAKKDHRPPTMFGEPHVIKHLRLISVSTVY